MNTTWVIIVFFLSLVFLLLGIIKLKMDSGMMMLLTALLMGILLGMPAAELVSTTATGFGNMMASLGIVVGLGSINWAVSSQSQGPLISWHWGWLKQWEANTQCWL